MYLLLAEIALPLLVAENEIGIYWPELRIDDVHKHWWNQQVKVHSIEINT
jgi:hypothetical protein